MTQNQPFCAGVIVLQDGCLLVTLNSDGLSNDLDASTWRVGGVGGGQEADESITECALREAREELCCEVRLIHSTTTYFHDLDSGEIRPAPCTDPVAPFLLQRQRNPAPSRPYRPGLPTGPYIYFGLYFADVAHSNIHPGDDVAGLLLLSLEQWSLLEQQPALETVLEHGARVIADTPLDRRRRLWLPVNESFSVVAALLRANPTALDQ